MGTRQDSSAAEVKQTIEPGQVLRISRSSPSAPDSALEAHPAYPTRPTAAICGFHQDHQAIQRAGIAALRQPCAGYRSTRSAPAQATWPVRLTLPRSIRYTIGLPVTGSNAALKNRTPTPLVSINVWSTSHDTRHRDDWPVSLLVDALTPLADRVHLVAVIVPFDGHDALLAPTGAARRLASTQHSRAPLHPRPAAGAGQPAATRLVVCPLPRRSAGQPAAGGSPVGTRRRADRARPQPGTASPNRSPTASTGCSTRPSSRALAAGIRWRSPSASTRTPGFAEPRSCVSPGRVTWCPTSPARYGPVSPARSISARVTRARASGPWAATVASC